MVGRARTIPVLVVVPDGGGNLIRELRSFDDDRTGFRVARRLEGRTVGHRQMAHVVEEGRRAKVLEVAGGDAEMAPHGIGYRGDAAGMTLSNRVAMVDGVSGGDYNLRAGIGKQSDQVFRRELELGHQLRERARAILALALGEIESLVGGRNQLLSRQCVLWISGDANAESQVLAWDSRHGRRVHGVDDSIRQALRANAVEVRNHEGELVAAVAGHKVLR